MLENELFSLVCKRRGITNEFFSEINTVKNDTLQDIDKFCSVLDSHKNDNIILICDFDMDGIMSSVIGVAGLRELGFNVQIYSLSTSHGYGFDVSDIEDMLKCCGKVDLVITADVGISCYDGIDKLKENDIDVIVTDHHTQNANDVSKMHADVVVNPHKVSETALFKDICGAEVLWMCLREYAQEYRDEFMQIQIDRLKLFAGIGVVSDCMPMLYDNREIVTDALSLCRLIYNNGNMTFINCLDGCGAYKNCLSGMYRVIDIFHREKKLKNIDDISSEFFGFYLAPMFNSVKRLGKDINIALNVFFGDANLSSMCVESLFMLNEQRKQEVQTELNKLLIDPTLHIYAPYIYFTNTQSGLFGLLANKLCLASNVPVLVIDEQTFEGSVRSPEWYPALFKLQNLGCQCGGHQFAFGVSLHSMDMVKRVYEFLSSDVPKVASQIDFTQIKSFDYCIGTTEDVDFTIDIEMFDDYLDKLEKLEPFGKHFEKPMGLVKAKRDDVQFTYIGVDKQHVKLILPQGLEVLCWNQAQLAHKLETTNDDIVVSGKLGSNIYNDTKTINFSGDLVC